MTSRKRKPTYKGPSETYAARVKRGRVPTTIILSPEAAARLDELAEQYDATKSSVVEGLILTNANVCEHGDHLAPVGSRFCSEACCKCEHESLDPNTGCDDICKRVNSG